MQIQLNGDAVQTDAMTITALVEALGLDIRKVAVERNLAIVPRSLHDTTLVQDGDRIEVVQFVGGG
ncbi:MAG: sulfur carrier protein ThiS [Brevundimonas sp.]|nr:MAG: sulfur carrier protein ThiS [Brevundimonas sp.]